MAAGMVGKDIGGWDYQVKHSSMAFLNLLQGYNAARGDESVCRWRNVLDRWQCGVGMGAFRLSAWRWLACMKGAFYVMAAAYFSTSIFMNYKATLVHCITLRNSYSSPERGVVIAGNQ